VLARASRSGNSTSTVFNDVVYDNQTAEPIFTAASSSSVLGFDTTNRCGSQGVGAVLLVCPNSCESDPRIPRDEMVTIVLKSEGSRAAGVTLVK
jgi:hypothetical protein